MFMDLSIRESAGLTTSGTNSSLSATKIPVTAFPLLQQSGKWVWLGIISLLLLLSSCMPNEPVKFNGIDKIKIGKVNKEGVSITLFAKLANPNNASFTVKDADIDVMVNNTSLGKIKLKEPIRVKRKTEEVYAFEVEANYADLLTGGIAGLINMVMKQKIKGSCQGWIKVRSMGITRTIPVSFNGDIPIEGDHGIKIVR
jgi:LEA14-like dessication related protein